MSVPTTEPHNNVLRPTHGHRRGALGPPDSFCMSGSLLNIASFSHSMSTML